MTTEVATGSLVCPACRARLERGHGDGGDGFDCENCRRRFDDVAGVPDLRLGSDRYLPLDAERAKAERLGAIEPTTDVLGLASAYYDITDDVVDHRRDRFLRHIAAAEARGDALLPSLPRAGRIVEVGCGTGGLLVAAARAGLEIHGVDIASRWLVVARRRLRDHGLDAPLVAAEAERLPWPDQSVDAVVADSLLEHLDDPATALREWRRVLRPGGRLVVWSPNRFSLATDPHHGLWGVGWLPRRLVPRYLRFRNRLDWPPRTLSAAEAGRLARSSGFESVRVDAPTISEAWARSRPEPEQRVLHVYHWIHRSRPGKAFLSALGPLWALSARASRRR